jgi:hypothetical protein
MVLADCGNTIEGISAQVYVFSKPFWTGLGADAFGPVGKMCLGLVKIAMSLLFLGRAWMWR